MLGRKRRTILILVVVLPLILFQAWSESADVKNQTEKKNGPASVEKLDDGLSRITLTDKAAERLNIKIEKVREENENDDDDKPKKYIPYSSVLYTSDGNTWVYTNPQPLVFVRARIVIHEIDDDHVVLTEGPPAGTDIVTIGVAELFGAETGLGK